MTMLDSWDTYLRLYSSHDLTPQQVYDEYRKGLIGNLIFGNYDMKITFYKDGQETVNSIYSN